MQDGDGGTREGEPREGSRRTAEPRDEPEERRPRLTARRAAILALEQLVELTGRAAEGIVGVERDHDGWKVTIEAVEDRHVPSTADIMAEYEVELDTDGELVAYHRRSRYVRGQT
ncbi:gas vesicle protein [Georgenia thermotolerans]|uniref:Gas vesicle protein n=1 Tax=Georgenia thermotolerans TaxID=527326 RepID=A0A7J5UNE7_9MICO|nr:gas vesicle protein [Georgenia thermotolerans]